MQLRTWPILALGFGTLVLLTALFGLDNWRRAGQIYHDVAAIHQTETEVKHALREIESGIYLSGIYVRDFLLDPSQISAGLHRQQLVQLRASMDRNLDELGRLITTGDRKLLDQLRREADAYWDSMDPIFDWTPQQKLAFSSVFLRKQVLPRRNAVLDVARAVRELNAADLEERQEQMDRKVAGYRSTGLKILIAALTLGVGVSITSILRISRLESRAELQHIRTERAEQELRRLSQQLVRAQEDERRSLSRELHDEVGQTLTALRVELGNLERLRAGPDEQYRQHLEDAKALAAQTLRSVRNLASGLRPSVLDDLGLGPALEWQAREFSRRTGIPVEVLLEGLPAALPEAHRTCVYRVVQEALTNCARHAAARNIRIALHTEAGRLSLAVQDDGRGLPRRVEPGAAAAGPGLGLIGIEERVRELGGSLAIQSQTGKGTMLKISIPLPAEAA